MTTKQILDRTLKVWKEGVTKKDCKNLICIDCELCSYCDVMQELILWHYNNEKLVNDLLKGDAK